MLAFLEGGLEVCVRFVSPPGIHLSIDAKDGHVRARLMASEPAGVREIPCPGLAVGIGQTCEIALPFACLGGRAGDQIRLTVAVRRGEMEVGQYPPHQAIGIEVPDEGYAPGHWTV